MSSAIEGAEVMLFGVCESYKESANCVRTDLCTRVVLDHVYLV
eukprot:COSAG06_NODE_129_length_22602_cov_7.116318_7_plen_43_part_00